MKPILALGILAPSPALAQGDTEGGKAKVLQFCAACHGANGVSVSDTIPNLAAQRAAYIENQLKAFKDGARKAPNATSPIPTMAATPPQLSPADTTNTPPSFPPHPSSSP